MTEGGRGQGGKHVHTSDNEVDQMNNGHNQIEDNVSSDLIDVTHVSHRREPKDEYE